MDDMKMKLKEKILDELMEDLDNGESEKLRPKPEVSAMAMEPSIEENSDPDELNDDDLKMLLDHYMK